MPKSKYTLTEQIERAKEDIKQETNKLKLLNQKNKEQERKARNHRLCKWGGYLESKLPEVITLTDEQYYSFLEKTLFTDHARRILAGLTERNAAIPSPRPTGETGATEAE